MTDRYEGRPLVMLLDNYVLWAMGELPAETEGKLAQMAPYLHKTFKAQGSWQDVVAKVMEFPAQLPADLHALWQRNLDIARTRKETLDPVQFAQAIVDQNFAEGL